jgi:hypothetical protein
MSCAAKRRVFCTRSRPAWGLLVSSVGLAVCLTAGTHALAARAQSGADEFNDSHFHLTNYVQQGISVQDFLQIMGRRVSRSTLFGIPLQQQWSYGNSGDYAPTYYLQSDAPLYYYSFTDAYIASQYTRLSKRSRRDSTR